MVPIGDMPIVWHIMQHYAQYEHKRFVLCLGYLSWRIKEFFLNYQEMGVDLTVTMGRDQRIERHDESPEKDWVVTLAETGLETGTAGRISRIARYIDDDNFMLTYGDGVADVDIRALEQFHLSHGKLLTMTGVIPPGRFGELNLDGDRVTEMKEKPHASDRYINGGFLIMNRKFITRYLSDADDSTMLEREPMEQAALDGELMMYRHADFWQCMDTFRDWKYLNDLWASGEAPWRVSS